VKKSFDIIFAGTPEFAAKTLQALLHSQHRVKAVYTQPDRPAGRGRKLTPSPVKELALQHNLLVHQPDTLRTVENQKILADLNADLMIVVAYGLLLPAPVLQAPEWGCINVHASLLPRWRGAAPIQRAILAGDEKTGITIMQMDEGLDTGAMLYKVECPIALTDTSETLHDRLAELGADALLKTLENFGEIKPEAQNQNLATYAHKIKKEEGKINWSQSAAEISRQVRAFNPWPVAFFGDAERAVRVWEAEEKTGTGNAGTIIHSSSEGIDVATGNGVIRLLKLQLPGGRVLTAAELLHSRASEFAVGKML
jgi:methionyl-tRNA formyltransferase